MLSLDEAIKHCEEKAEELEETVKGCYDDTEIMNNCYECAKEHRQLAEWLKKLKAYESDNEICKYCIHTDDADYCDICKHSTILVDYFDMEVNADGPTIIEGSGSE